jgi:hypothetical protein
MSQPTPPYFLWNNRQHSFTCITPADAAQAGKKVSRITLVSDYDSNCTIYDSEGTTWGFHFVGRKEEFSFFDRLLAEVYNPSREFPVRIRNFAAISSRSFKVRISMVSLMTMTS